MYFIKTPLEITLVCNIIRNYMQHNSRVSSQCSFGCNSLETTLKTTLDCVGVGNNLMEILIALLANVVLSVIS